MKTDFCKKKGIKLYRYNIEHWKTLESHIVDLMLSLKIPIKIKKPKINLDTS